MCAIEADTMCRSSRTIRTLTRPIYLRAIERTLRAVHRALLS
jgi:hypothetical protein